MKRVSNKKVVSLSEHKSMMDMLKKLYGNDEVKNDSTSTEKTTSNETFCNTQRGTRTAMASEMAKSSLQAKKVLHKDK